MAYDDNFNYQSPDDKDAVIQNYLMSKLGKAPVDDSPERLANNADLEKGQALANLTAGLNNASAAFSGGLYKANNDDLMASNKDRQQQIAANDHIMAAGQQQAGKERSAAVAEYLSAKRHNDQMAFEQAKEKRQDNYQQQALAQHADELDQNRQLKKQLADAAASSKSDLKKSKERDDDEKLYTEEENAVNAPGRKKPVVVQAETGNLAINKALELVNKYKNPNDMSQQEYGLLVEELGKVASGGTGSDATRHAIGADTFESQFQNIMSKAKGAPQPAQLGAFIKQNKDYLEKLKNVNDNVIKDDVRNVHQAYKNRYHNKEVADRFTTFHANAFDTSKPPAVEDQAPKGAPGEALSAPAPPPQKDVHEMSKEELLKELGQ